MPRKSKASPIIISSYTLEALGYFDRLALERKGTVSYSSLVQRGIWLSSLHLADLGLVERKNNRSKEPRYGITRNGQEYLNELLRYAVNLSNGGATIFEIRKKSLYDPARTITRFVKPSKIEAALQQENQDSPTRTVVFNCVA